VDGGASVARGADSGDTWSSSSLLDLMPIASGELLPENVAKTPAARIEAHLTPYGPATELPASPHHRPDGYWRGPIRAPATVLVEDGPRRSGHHRLADEIQGKA
jgi:glycogen debranching enzyme